MQIVFGERTGFGDGVVDISSGIQELSFEIFEWDFIDVIFIGVFFLDIFDEDACEGNVLERYVFLRVAGDDYKPFVSDEK